jgi:hypothetical protein
MLTQEEVAFCHSLNDWDLRRLLSKYSTSKPKYIAMWRQVRGEDPPNQAEDYQLARHDRMLKDPELPASSRANSDKRQKYEAKIRNLRAQVHPATVPTLGQLRAFLGDRIYEAIGFDGASEDPAPTQWLLDRYFSQGGLTRFLCECFPTTTSRSPFGDDQLRSIEIMEAMIRNGGVQQLLEPRAFGKTSRVARAALWAAALGYRRCIVCFQSNVVKAEQTLEKIKNELTANIMLQAIFPKLVACCCHAKENERLKQHWGGRKTNIQWKTASIRLPDVPTEDGEDYEPWSGCRIFTMPFAKAAGIALSDPITLEDIRPDLLLPDDVQSNDDALNKPSTTQTLLDVWRTSVKYLGGRGKQIATLFTQTICSPDDMAAQLAADPSIHTVRYGLIKEFATNHDWWMGPYREVLQSYDPIDPNGQAKARKAASQLYRDNYEMAKEGAVVAWECSYDPESCYDALEAGYRNLIEDEASFWSQDMNDPRSQFNDEDIRCKPKAIMAKQHNEPRRTVPEFASDLVCHIDVQDTLLYYMVCASTPTMSMAMIDNQTIPSQVVDDFTLRKAPLNFLSYERYASLPTVADRVRAALQDLIDGFREYDKLQYFNSSGDKFKFAKIGIDCSDGDHWDTVHEFCRDMKDTNLVPMKGWSPSKNGMPMAERSKSSTERRRGDHWIEKVHNRTKTKWLEYDAAYYKKRLHEGLKAPIGTSLSVSLWHTNSERVHRMTANHCNNEIPSWEVSQRANETATGRWAWTLKPNAENHRFDNFTGCLALTNYIGGRFPDVKPRTRKIRQRVTMADAMRQHGFQRD